MDIFQMIKCALIDFCNLLIDHVLNNILSAIAFMLDLLPTLPIPTQTLVWGDFGRALAYFVPIPTMILHFLLLLSLLVIWYSYEYIMRWIKLIK